MRKTSFFIIAFLFSLIVACTSQNKKAEEAKTEPAMPKNFERVIPPAMLTSPQDRADYMLMHYWDKFDFKDTMYCHAPDITEQAFVDFLVLFPYASYETVCKGVQTLMNAASIDSVMYAYFTEKADHYLYNPNSQMRNDEYYLPFAEHCANSSILDFAESVRVKKHYSLVCKNRINTKGADFTFTKSNGQSGTLYGIKADYVLVLFYNPGCPECAHTIEILKNMGELTATIKAGTLKILAVYPDQNLDEWREHQNEIPSTWINGYNKALDIKDKEIYDLKAIPSIYLFDKNKIILMKDCSTADLHNYFTRDRQN